MNAVIRPAIHAATYAAASSTTTGSTLATQRWLGAMLLPALRLPVQVPVAAAVSLLAVWMLAVGVWLWRAGKAQAGLKV